MGLPTPWSTLSGNIASQGDKFNGHISSSNQYYAFLSKADFVEGSGYDIFFELVNKEWMDNAIMSSPTDIKAMAPTPPGVCYSIEAVDTQTLLTTLGLKSEDDIAEGSWFLMTLAQGQGKVTGDVYDADMDMVSEGPS